MKSASVPAILFGVGLVLGVSLPATASHSFYIGVISPTEGASREVGLAHQNTIRFAIDRLQTELDREGVAARLELIEKNDRGIPEEAVKAARALLEENDVIAILGPVNSASTGAVLAEGLEVPILSSLSTAPSLGQLGNPWFFRTIFTDEYRMQQYVASLKTTEKMSDRTLILYERDEYGTELAELTRRMWAEPAPRARPWEAVLSTGAYPVPVEALKKGDGFRSDFLAELTEIAPKNVFVYGKRTWALAIANGLAAVSERSSLTPPTFFFVGYGNELLDNAPLRSVTIGDPVITSSAWDCGRGDAGFDRVLDEFAAQHGRENFVMTAYEAAYCVLGQALRKVMSEEGDEGEGGVRDMHALREQLRHELEGGTFDSLRPGREIRFNKGERLKSPAPPVYQIVRAFHRLDGEDEGAWIDLICPQKWHYLEGPVKIRLRQHATIPGRVKLTIQNLQDDRWKEVNTHVPDLTKGEGTYYFHPPSPGRFRVVTDPPSVPALLVFDVDKPWNYLVSLLTAAFGALLAMYARPQEKGLRSWLRLPIGLLSGVVTTGLSFYGSEVSGWLQIPTLSEVPAVNAALTGLIGGCWGPRILRDAPKA